ncbi:hypothetical protein ATN84_02700 [Paramesorhizobium deserti]|uniref:Uncharacterized protein n=1 Tax=Paramesorhizobium deserti TaxID=1494590 RepID=A0A135HZR7_9HYPH|nr:hypothetical protein ATN84_02700 [Paramesorhizobium deserti]
MVSPPPSKARRVRRGETGGLPLSGLLDMDLYLPAISHAGDDGASLIHIAIAIGADIVVLVEEIGGVDLQPRALPFRIEARALPGKNGRCFGWMI